MSWWMWTLVGIFAYLMIGALCAVWDAYDQGRRHPDREEPIELGFSMSLWPIFLVIMFIASTTSLYTGVLRYGQTSEQRKTKRQEKRDYKKMIEDFAKENNLDPKKLQSPVG